MTPMRYVRVAWRGVWCGVVVLCDVGVVGVVLWCCGAVLRCGAVVRFSGVVCFAV